LSVFLKQLSVHQPISVRTASNALKISSEMSQCNEWLCASTDC